MFEQKIDLKNKKVLVMLTLLVFTTTIIRVLFHQLNLPNIEPVMAATLISSLIFGPLGGFVVGGSSMFLSDLLIPPIGIDIVYTVLAFGFVGILSGYWKRMMRYSVGVAAVSLTIIYDLVTNVGFAFQFGLPIWQTEVAGIPFMIIHLLSNFAICVIVVPIIAKAMAKELAKIPVLIPEQIPQEQEISVKEDEK
jgi:uncharacterized membrane protein